MPFRQDLWRALRMMNNPFPSRHAHVSSHDDADFLSADFTVKSLKNLFFLWIWYFEKPPKNSLCRWVCRGKNALLGSFEGSFGRKGCFGWVLRGRKDFLEKFFFLFLSYGMGNNIKLSWRAKGCFKFFSQTFFSLYYLFARVSGKEIFFFPKQSYEVIWGFSQRVPGINEK